jgi:cell division protein FtsB
MDHAGETGDPFEIEAGAETDDGVLEAIVVDDEDDAELEQEIELEPEIEVDLEDDLAALEALEDADALAAGEVDDVEDLVPDDADVTIEQRDESRQRHPAGAAALAKRVAMDRSARIAVGSLVLVAMMFLFVFPTRSYLAQQRQVRDARHSVQVLRAQNSQLAREAKRLRTPSEIERLARSQFNMVFEGEEAYNVVPPQGSATTTTTTP